MTTEKLATRISEKDKALRLESSDLFGERYEIRIKDEGPNRVQVRVLIGRLVAIGNGDNKTEAFESALDDVLHTLKREFFHVRDAYDAFLDDYIDKMLHLGKHEDNPEQE